ncbi:MAG: flagellar assembly protein FliW [Desulfobacteraceae bacterium]|nr:flagellar assembly protein FliW [Desulfobacteraceae bacterium]
MKILTRKFGEIEVDEKKILHMPHGLPGFGGCEKFVLLEDPKTAPFCWFQSVDEPDLSLIVMNPFLFKPDYTLDLDDYMKTLNWKGITPKDLVIFVVVNVREKDREKTITANLMGPLVINPKKNEAVQVVISDSPYSHQHNVLESL